MDASLKAASVRNLISTIALVLTAGQLQAAVVLDTFSNIEPSIDYNLQLLGAPGFDQNVAVQFSVTSATAIDSLVAAIEGTGSNVKVGIMADAAGSPSNLFLHETVLTNPTRNIELNGLNWALSPGQYWLAAVAAPGFNGSWFGTGNVHSRWAFQNPPLTDWNITESGTVAARISLVPEPSAYLLMFAGLGFVICAARRRIHT